MQKEIVQALGLIMSKKYPYPKGCNSYSHESVVLSTLNFNGIIFNNGFSYVSCKNELVIIPKEEMEK